MNKFKKFSLLIVSVLFLSINASAQRESEGGSTSTGPINYRACLSAYGLLGEKLDMKQINDIEQQIYVCTPYKIAKCLLSNLKNRPEHQLFSYDISLCENINLNSHILMRFRN